MSLRRNNAIRIEFCRFFPIFFRVGKQEKKREENE